MTCYESNFWRGPTHLKNQYCAISIRYNTQKSYGIRVSISCLGIKESPIIILKVSKYSIREKHIELSTLKMDFTLLKTSEEKECHCWHKYLLDIDKQINNDKNGIEVNKCLLRDIKKKNTEVLR